MSIGNNIKNYRKMNGLSQKELAEKLRISDKTICSWEIGRTEPNMGMVENICKIFGITKDELISGTKSNIPKYDPDILEIIELLDKIKPEQKQSILTMLRSFAK